jgi:tetratricopeptide (TPR) repeat protein
VGLTATESLQLLGGVATALAVAHRRGIVHRDLKPANLFLRGGSPADVAILDFGIAHRPQSPNLTALTQTGAVLGTPQYMSPEQARGERGVLPAADVFSLGAILFECLTGLPPFSGEQLAAVLAKILFTDPPPLARLRPDLPAVLGDLLAAMLHKDPAARPADADAVLARLHAVPGLADLPAPLPRRESGAERRLTHAEQHYVCVLAAAVPRQAADTQATIFPQSPNAEAAAERGRMEQPLLGLGADIEWLPDDTLICSLARISHVADQARQVARAALALSKHWPEALVTVVTAQSQRSELGGLPMGVALDRAVRLLRQTGRTPEPTPQILIDELTARFLDARFVTKRQPNGLFSLSAIVEEGGLSPKLLGRRAPFVGRESEIGTLLGIYRSCCEESVSRAVLVTAPPGTGKSRLLHEVRQRLAEEDTAIHWLMAQAEPVGLGASGGLIGQAIARFAQLGTAEDGPARRRLLREFATTHVPPPQALQVAAFLGELCGVPFPEQDHPALAASRLSPQVRSEQQSQAVLSLLSALSRKQPTLLVLEDLHWADEQTVRIIDLALRELPDQPLLVLAFARPEVHEVFPRLWSERNLQELRLPPLSKRAGEILIKSCLGEAIDAATRARIVAQSGGNALFLEELIRAQHEGQTDEAPQTILAILQSRLLRLAPELRRVLRAASVFGASCDRDGILAVIGEEDESSTIDAALLALCREEILERREPGKGSGQAQRQAEAGEYGFRHALMQQAAYSLLPAPERRHAHAQAAGFLIASGTGDPAEIAGHFERGGEPERAVPYYLAAAQHGHDQSELALALRYIERALACGAATQPAAHAHALALQCMIYRYQGEHALMIEVAEGALVLLPPGGAWWFQILFCLALPLRTRGERERVVELAERWMASLPQPGAEAACLEAGAWFTILLSQMAERDAATQLWGRIEEVIAQQSGCPPYVSGLVSFARYEYHRVFAPNPERQLSEIRTACELLSERGSRRDSCAAQISLGQALAERGDIEEGERRLGSAVQFAERLRQPYLVLIAKAHLMDVLARREGSAPQAEQLAREILDAPSAGEGYRGWAQLILGELHLRRGALTEAAMHLQQAIQLTGGSPLRRLSAESLRVHLLLRTGAIAAARTLAEATLAETNARGGGGYCATTIGLAALGARFAAGDLQGASELQRSIAAEVLRRASLIPDGPARRGYLSQLPENVAALSPRPWLFPSLGG